jgi:cobalt import ATP-binding protein cbiO 1
MSIEVRNLIYEYSPNTPFATKALDDVTFTIEEGDFFGIIGHTGSGKSTLSQHFNALIKPQQGRVFVLSFDLSDKKLDYKKLRSQVGMVFQYPEYQLFAETVEADVAFGLKNFMPELSEDERSARVREAIELVGLEYDKVAKASPFELSGGQKRRVAIAGVIVTRPKILVLDEPTAGLDPRGKKEILALIHTLKDTCCPTIIMIGHDMDEIAQNCTRVLVLAEGKVRFVTTPQELFREGRTLSELHLELPTAARIAEKLNEKGFHLHPSAFTARELAELISAEIQPPIVRN